MTVAEEEERWVGRNRQRSHNDAVRKRAERKGRKEWPLTSLRWLVCRLSQVHWDMILAQDQLACATFIRGDIWTPQEFHADGGLKKGLLTNQQEGKLSMCLHVASDSSHANTVYVYLSVVMV